MAHLPAHQAPAWYHAVLSFFLRHPKGLFVLLALPLGAALWQLPRLQIVTDLRSLIPNDRIAQTDAQIRDDFSIRDYMLVAIHNPDGVFNPETGNYARQLEQDLLQIPAILHVRSLFTEDDIFSVGNEGIHIAPFLKDPFSKSALEQARNAVHSFPGVIGILASEDNQYFPLIAEMVDGETKADIYARIQETLKARPPPANNRVLISGMPVLEGVLGENIFKDLAFMLPLVAFILIILLKTAFSSWSFTFLCLIETLYVDILTLGLMAFFGIPLFLIQSIMPIILMGLAITDEIHIFSHYLNEVQKDPVSPPEDCVRRTMDHMLRPIAFTSLTTAVAFLSFMSASMPAMRYFGIFTAVGVIIAMIFSCLVSPVFILLTRRSPPVSQNHLETKWLSGIGDILIRHQWKIGLLFALIFVLIAAGFRWVKIDDGWLRNFSDDSQVHKDTQEIEASLTGTMLLQVQIDTGDSNGILKPEFLRSLARSQSAVEKIPDVTTSFSIVQPLQRTMEAFTEEQVIPASGDAVAQFLFLLEDSSHADRWDTDKKSVLLTIFIQDASYQQGLRIFDSLERIRSTHLPNTTWKYGGHYALNIHWVGLIRRDLPTNVAISLFAIWLLCAWLFRSAKTGLIVMSPIALAIAATFASLGALEIPISVAVSMFSSIIFGVGIDYAIHFQHTYQSVKDDPETKGNSIERTFGSVGSAIFWSAICVSLAFAVLLFSTMPPVRSLGIVVCLGMITSLLSSLTFLPWILVVKENN